jgi:hypothetical protein
MPSTVRALPTAARVFAKCAASAFGFAASFSLLRSVRIATGVR